MPATERSFSDPPPGRLYLDTDFLISCLIETQPHHERCRPFLDRLAQFGQTEIYVSPLSWLEFTHVVSKERFRLDLPEGMQQSYELHRWQDAQVRERYLTDLLSQFERLLLPFEWGEIPITADVRHTAIHYMMTYRLDPQDAGHVAAAWSLGIADIAALDRAFRKVDGITLWNDLIYTRNH